MLDSTLYCHFLSALVMDNGCSGGSMVIVTETGIKKPSSNSSRVCCIYTNAIWTIPALFSTISCELNRIVDRAF